MAKILRNDSSPAVNIELKKSGITIVPGAPSQYVIDIYEYNLFATDDVINELTAHINAGDIVVNDGLNDLSAADGIRFLKYPDTAFNQRFLSGLDRSNDFVSKTTQEAIEEARGDGSVIGRTFVASFNNGGQTGNKWLFNISTSSATDTLPYNTPFDIDIFGATMTNKIDNKNVDIEFYKNGVAPGDLVYTLEVRLGLAQKEAHITTLSNLFTMSIDDSLSVYVKKIGGDQLQSPVVDIFCRINSNTVGESGVA